MRFYFIILMFLLSSCSIFKNKEAVNFEGRSEVSSINTSTSLTNEFDGTTTVEEIVSTTRVFKDSTIVEKTEKRTVKNNILKSDSTASFKQADSITTSKLKVKKKEVEKQPKTFNWFILIGGLTAILWLVYKLRKV